MSREAYPSDRDASPVYDASGITSRTVRVDDDDAVLNVETERRRAAEHPDDADDSEAEVEEIRSEIEHTRAEMSQTIDAIQERLSPRRLVHEAQESVREATVGKAERMMNDASDRVTEAVETVGDTARGMPSSLMDAVRRNPVAAAVAGIGLGWLFMSARQSDHDRYDGDGRYRAYRRATHYPPYGARPAGMTYSGYARGYPGSDYAYGYRGADYDYDRYEHERSGGLTHKVGSAVSDVQDRAGEMVSSTGERLSDTVSGVADRASRMQDQVSEKAGRMQDRVTDTASHMQDRASEWVDEFGDVAQERFYEARHQYDRFMQDSPIAVGAVALAMGVAVGLVLPSTRPERRVMGDARERVMGQAQEVFQDTAQKVQRVVDEVQSTVKDTVQEEAKAQGLMGDASSGSSGSQDHAQGTKGQSQGSPGSAAASATRPQGTPGQSHSPSQFQGTPGQSQGSSPSPASSVPSQGSRSS